MGASPSSISAKNSNSDLKSFYDAYYTANGGASSSTVPTIEEIKEKKKRFLSSSSSSSLSSSSHPIDSNNNGSKSNNNSKKKSKKTKKKRKNGDGDDGNDECTPPPSSPSSHVAAEEETSSNHGDDEEEENSTLSSSSSNSSSTSSSPNFLHHHHHHSRQHVISAGHYSVPSSSSSSFSPASSSSSASSSFLIKNREQQQQQQQKSKNKWKTKEQFKNWKHYSKISSLLIVNHEHLLTSSLDKYICQWSLPRLDDNDNDDDYDYNNDEIDKNQRTKHDQCQKLFIGHTKAVTSLFVKQVINVSHENNIEDDDGDDSTVNDENWSESHHHHHHHHPHAKYQQQLSLVERDCFYSTSQDCTVRKWNMTKGECVRVYTGSENWLTCGVATENYVCCAGYDCSVHVFDEKTGKRLHKLNGHHKRIEHLVISKESGSVLYSSSADGTVRSWDLESGDCLAVFSCREHCYRMVLYEPKNLLFCSLFNEVSIIDLESDDHHHQQQQQQSRSTVYAPLLNFNSFQQFDECFLIGWDTDAKLFRIWDIEQEKFIREFKCPLAGSMISTPSMTVHNGVLYFVKGTSVQHVSIRDILRESGEDISNENESNDKQQRKGKEKLNQTPAYVRFLDLFHYFTDVLLIPSRQVADMIEQLESQQLLSVEMNLDTQIEVLKRQQIREGKRSESSSIGSSSKDTSDGDDQNSIHFSISFNLPEFECDIDANSLYTEEERNLDFETRTELFYQRLYHGDEEVQQPTVVLVRRSDLVFDACKHFSTMTESDLKRPMYIFFAHEHGLDTGGVTREFYKLLSEQILDPTNALFLKTGMNGTYHPNPTSAVNEDHLQYFTFIGKLVGKCLYDLNLMDTHFSRVIFKLIVGKPITFEDMEYCDPSLYLAMKNILAYDQVEHMFLTFTAELNDFGSNNTFPLVYGGEHIPVTNENKKQFVELYSRWKLVESVRPQLTLFLSGLYSVIPRPYFSIFSESELELLLCGKPKISVRDWQQHCKYEAGFSESHPTIKQFWKMVTDMNDTQRSQLLQFVTGTSCVPPEGFRGLYPNFTICCVRVPKNENKNQYLPVAHTCLNRLDFPAYDVVGGAPSTTNEDDTVSQHGNGDSPLSVSSMAKLFDSSVKHGLVDGFLLY